MCYIVFDASGIIKPGTGTRTRQHIFFLKSSLTDAWTRALFVSFQHTGYAFTVIFQWLFEGRLLHQLHQS